MVIMGSLNRKLPASSGLLRGHISNPMTTPSPQTGGGGSQPAMANGSRVRPPVNTVT